MKICYISQSAWHTLNLHMELFTVNVALINETPTNSQNPRRSVKNVGFCSEEKRFLNRAVN